MHTAVIPAAGLGTRFLPATKAVPKELMPIFDTPALQLVMDEAIGGKIADYLIKPVNPRQILSTIIKLTEGKRLETESVTQRYQQDFRNIGMAFMDYLDWPKWKEMYKKLVYWETEMAGSEETGMEEILKTQKQDGNREFSKYIARNYINFVHANGDNEESPLMSHHLIQKGVLPHKQKGEPFCLLLLDNLRFDQWKAIQVEISKYYRTTSEDLYMAILPTTTQYARNAIFSGLMPSDIEKRFGDKWSNDEDEGQSVSKFQMFIVGYDLNVLCFDLIGVYNIIKAIYVKF